MDSDDDSKDAVLVRAMDDNDASQDFRLFRSSAKTYYKGNQAWQTMTFIDNDLDKEHTIEMPAEVANKINKQREIIERYQLIIGMVRSTKDALEHQVNHLQTQISQFQTLQQQRTEKARLETAKALSVMEAKCQAKLSQMTQEHEGQLAALRISDNQQLGAMQRRIEQLELEKTENEQEMHRMSTKSANQKRLKTEMEDLLNQLESKNQSIAKFDTQIIHFKQQTNSLEQEKNSLAQEHKSLLTEHQKLRMQLYSLRNELELKARALARTDDAYKQEVASLKRQLSGDKEQTSQLLDSIKTLTTARDQNDNALLSQLSKLHEDKNELQLALQSKSAESDAHARALEAAEAENAQLKKKLAHCAAQFEAQSTSLKELELANAAHEDKIERLQTSSAASKHALAQAQNELTALKADDAEESKEADPADADNIEDKILAAVMDQVGLDDFLRGQAAERQKEVLFALMQVFENLDERKEDAFEEVMDRVDFDAVWARKKGKISDKQRSHSRVRPRKKKYLNLYAMNLELLVKMEQFAIGVVENTGSQLFETFAKGIAEVVRQNRQNWRHWTFGDMIDFLLSIRDSEGNVVCAKYEAQLRQDQILRTMNQTIGGPFLLTLLRSLDTLGIEDEETKRLIASEIESLTHCDSFAQAAVPPQTYELMNDEDVLAAPDNLEGSRPMSAIVKSHVDLRAHPAQTAQTGQAGQATRTARATDDPMQIIEDLQNYHFLRQNDMLLNKNNDDAKVSQETSDTARAARAARAAHISPMASAAANVSAKTAFSTHDSTDASYGSYGRYGSKGKTGVNGMNGMVGAGVRSAPRGMQLIDGVAGKVRSPEHWTQQGLQMAHTQHPGHPGHSARAHKRAGDEVGRRGRSRQRQAHEHENENVGVQKKQKDKLTKVSTAL